MRFELNISVGNMAVKLRLARTNANRLVRPPVQPVQITSRTERDARITGGLRRAGLYPRDRGL
jgi:hypothetical protein